MECLSRLWRICSVQEWWFSHTCTRASLHCRYYLVHCQCCCMQCIFAIWCVNLTINFVYGASSSTFCPHSGGSLGSVPSVAFCMAWYGSTSLQQSSKGSCSLLVSGHNLRVYCQWRTLVPLLNCVANAALASVMAPV